MLCLNIAEWRLHDFYVHVSMISPEEEAPSAANSQLCGFHAASVAASAMATMTCNTPLQWGRYVSVQIVGSNELITLCEFEVFEETGEECFRNVITMCRHKLARGCTRRNFPNGPFHRTHFSLCMLKTTI